MHAKLQLYTIRTQARARARTCIRAEIIIFTSKNHKCSVQSFLIYYLYACDEDFYPFCVAEMQITR